MHAPLTGAGGHVRLNGVAAAPEPDPAATVTEIQLSSDTAVQSHPCCVAISTRKLPPDAGAPWDEGWIVRSQLAIPDGPTLPPANSVAPPQATAWATTVTAAIRIPARARMTTSLHRWFTGRTSPLRKRTRAENRTPRAARAARVYCCCCCCCCCWAPGVARRSAGVARHPRRERQDLAGEGRPDRSDLHTDGQFAFARRSRPCRRRGSAARRRNRARSRRGCAAPPRCRLLVGSKPDPAELRQERFGPGVRRVRRRSILTLVAAEQVAAHVPRRDAELPRQRDEDVREVLAHAAPRRQRLVNRRVDARAARAVFEVRIRSPSSNGAAPRADRRRARSDARAQSLEQRRRSDERARARGSPRTSPDAASASSSAHAAGTEPIGQRFRLDALDERFRGQRQARMARRDVEVVDRVAVVVLDTS